MRVCAGPATGALDLPGGTASIRDAAVTQLTLPGFETPRLAAEHRLFFATLPDPGTAARIAALAARLRAGCRTKAAPLRADRLHITLHHLGDFAYVPPVLVARACAAAAHLDMPPFGVTVDRIVVFRGRPGYHPWALAGGAGPSVLGNFQQALGGALKRAGLRISGARFMAHVTLLYSDSRFDPRAIEPIEWTVRDFVLIHSWLGKTRYEVLGRWPLKERGSTH